MLEKTVVKNIMKLLKKDYPGFYFKTHGGPFQMAGLPDILGCHKGRFIGIEVKAPGKEDTLTILQKKVLRLIRNAGGIAFMATTPKQVNKQLKEEFKDVTRKKTRKT